MILNFISHKLPRTLLASLLIIAPFNLTWAAQNKNERWYEVEVIVFNNTDTQLQTSEKWPEDPGTPSINNVLDLFTEGELLLDDVDPATMYYIEPLEPSEDNLTPLAKKISTSNNYNLLMHRTWRQTVAPKRATRPVYLDDNLTDKLYQPLADPIIADEENADITPEQQLLEALLAEEANFTSLQDPIESFFIHQLDPIEPFDENQAIPVSQPVVLTPVGPPAHTLFGTLRFFKNRYLHVGIDFSFRPQPYEAKVEEMSLEQVFPMAQDNAEVVLVDEEQLIKSVENLSFSSQEKPPYVGFRINESKRIRLKEVHYFDHPLYGVIVRVSGYTPPEPDLDIEIESVEISSNGR